MAKPRKPRKVTSRKRDPYKGIPQEDRIDVEKFIGLALWRAWPSGSALSCWPTSSPVRLTPQQAYRELLAIRQKSADEAAAKKKKDEEEMAQRIRSDALEALSECLYRLTDTCMALTALEKGEDGCWIAPEALARFANVDLGKTGERLERALFDLGLIQKRDIFCE